MAGFCHHGCLATPVIQEIQWAKPKPHQTIIFHGFTEDFLRSQWEIHYWGNLFVGGIFWWRSWGKSKFLMGKKCSHWRTSIYVYIIEDRYICSLSFMNYLPGWWFGTWILFFHMLWIILPFDILVTHQGPVVLHPASRGPFGRRMALWRALSAGFVLEIWSEFGKWEMDIGRYNYLL